MSSSTNSLRLEPGDLVRIVAPAGKGNQANIPLIKSYVESLGLVANITDGIYGMEYILYAFI